jgi:putative ABC transport system substrate-binding protein
VRSALRALVEARPDAALLASDTLLLGERRQIVDTMATSKIPAIYPFREYAEVGGFIAYGANISILFGPGNLPVQQATAFEIIVNQRAAAGLGLTLPASVLVRADEVIE